MYGCCGWAGRDEDKNKEGKDRDVSSNRGATERARGEERWCLQGKEGVKE